MAIKFKAKRLVTIPQLKLLVAQPVYVFIASEIYRSKEIQRGDPEKEDEKPMEAPELVKAVNLEDYSPCEVILGEVIKGELREIYGATGYVGRCFKLEQLEKPKGKRYRLYNAMEIEPEGVDMKKVHAAAELLGATGEVGDDMPQGPKASPQDAVDPGPPKG